jgi:Flp pilus assembly protein TadD
VNLESAGGKNPLSSTVVICLLLAAVVFAVYFPVLHYGFVDYDDGDYFFNNAHVQGGFSRANVSWAFTSSEAVNWHPLTWLSLMLDAQLFGQGAAAPHLVNVVLHAANSILLFLLLRRLTGARWQSTAVAMFFAVHPLHVESVAWVSERKDVLSGFFALLTLLCYERYVRAEGRQPRQKWVFYSLAILLFACGLMSKPMLVTLPFVMLLLDFWPLGRFTMASLPRLLLEKVPFILLSAAASVATFLVQHQGGAVTSLNRFPLSLRIENAFISYARYLGKTFWPIDLATPYPAPEYRPAVVVVLAVTLFIGLCAVALMAGKKFPFVFAGWFWFAGMLVPVIGLVQVGPQSMGDRYMYLPLIGILVIIVWGAGELSAKYRPPRLLIPAIAVILLLACAVRARNQVGAWRDSGTLFGHAMAVTDKNYFSALSLGAWYAKIGQTEQSLHYYYEAARVSPGDASDLYDAANAFAKLGHWPEAIDIYHRALQAAPNDPDILNNLGFALAQNHQLPEATACFRDVLKLEPNSVEAHNNLATILFAQGNYQGAAQEYQSALKIKPDDAVMNVNLGDTLVRLGQKPAAIESYQRALRLEPGNAQIRARLQALGVSSKN